MKNIIYGSFPSSLFLALLLTFLTVPVMAQPDDENSYLLKEQFSFGQDRQEVRVDVQKKYQKKRKSTKTGARTKKRQPRTHRGTKNSSHIKKGKKGKTGLGRTKADQRVSSKND